jgi:Glyoxalase superfamily protein
MRDFRDAKVMARTLRSALATKGLDITVSQSLELIAEAFGVADWNTLSAAIRGEAAGPRNPLASVSYYRHDAPGARLRHSTKAPVRDARAPPARPDR